MTVHAAIVDTNVVVAGLLTGETTSPVARVLDGMLGAAFPFVVSEELLAEYHVVLVRPRLARLHGLSAGEVASLLEAIALNAIVVPPGRGPKAPDAGDQFLWDLLAARDDLMLVTGDKRLLGARSMAGRVIAPADFVKGGGRAA